MRMKMRRATIKDLAPVDFRSFSRSEMSLSKKWLCRRHFTEYGFPIIPQIITNTASIRLSFFFFFYFVFPVLGILAQPIIVLSEWNQKSCGFCWVLQRKEGKLRLLCGEAEKVLGVERIGSGSGSERGEAEKVYREKKTETSRKKEKKK
jgi:hypothetical protein